MRVTTVICELDGHAVYSKQGLQALMGALQAAEGGRAVFGFRELSGEVKELLRAAGESITHFGEADESRVARLQVVHAQLAAELAAAAAAAAAAEAEAAPEEQPTELLTAKKRLALAKALDPHLNGASEPLPVAELVRDSGSDAEEEEAQKHLRASAGAVGQERAQQKKAAKQGVNLLVEPSAPPARPAAGAPCECHAARPPVKWPAARLSWRTMRRT